MGLDTLAHLKENVAMATNFQHMPENERAALHASAVRVLADVQPVWERPGYQDGALG